MIKIDNSIIEGTCDLCPDCMKELEDFLNNKIKGAQTNERL